MSEGLLRSLVERARDGSATHSDATEASRFLIGDSATPGRYDALFVIGKSGATQYRALVERFLDSPDDPMLARLALQILCNWWGPREDCRDHLDRFIEGVGWDLDDGGFVQLVAISAAGEHLRDREDPRLIQALLALYDDEQRPSLVREQAYIAIARAQGQPWNKVSGPGKGNWQEHVDADLINGARLRASDSDGP
jgi:hypothetical protein